MPSPSRFFALAALLVSATALVPPGRQGVPVAGPGSSNTSAPMTDNLLIVKTASEVDQKSGPSVDAPPNASIPPTSVTAVDGTLTNTTVADAGSSRRRDAGWLSMRASGFEKLFDGLPIGQHDASIEGTAYLTYTVVNNATYNVQACLDWCAGIDGCVFVNVFYEFNNFLLDFVFSEKSNLKCAAYGDIHTAAEKTNFGGQASYPQVGNETVPLTFITQSSGWGLDSLVDPTTPAGYELVFGPTDGANNAPGYMGFAFIDKYDVDACAQLCNTRGVDPVGGGCAYFNIWRALVDGLPTTYTCSMYYLVADESTAVNFGQGDLLVTYSRGYRRISVLPDGGFEGYTGCSTFCFTASYSNWIGTSPPSGNWDATVFFYPPYAHTGHSVALLTSADGVDSKIGTLTPAKKLGTEVGTNYVIQGFFLSAFGGAQLEANAKVDILWNGVRVGGTSGFTPAWKFVEVPVVGTGNDTLTFVGGSVQAWTFIDDVFIYAA
ncbi:hypothetical protein B0H16DRAFT_362083 [Mycena metata]|uniref:Fruit-body specific protein a n=1 Tax=Mycena metata TaxID=1033252 RepID=A0AAD7HKG8_9AGAR|nr:hypothetical protein B0H16DRAFT_362083 [Mycena metata]